MISFAAPVLAFGIDERQSTQPNRCISDFSELFFSTLVLTPALFRVTLNGEAHNHSRPNDVKLL